MDYLKLLTKEVTVNGLTFRMFPYRRNSWRNSYLAMCAHYDADFQSADDIMVKMPLYAPVWHDLDHATVDITADDKAGLAHSHRALLEFWKQRPTGEFHERLELFYQHLPEDIRETWSEAWNTVYEIKQSPHPDQPEDDAPEA